MSLSKRKLLWNQWDENNGVKIIYLPKNSPNKDFRQFWSSKSEDSESCVIAFKHNNKICDVFDFHYRLRYCLRFVCVYVLRIQRGSYHDEWCFVILSVRFFFHLHLMRDYSLRLCVDGQRRDFDISAKNKNQAFKHYYPWWRIEVFIHIGDSVLTIAISNMKNSLK